MEYENINWENREVARPRTYKMIQNADGTVTLTPAPGVVINKGTPLDRENLNHMDKGISDCAATANEATKLAKKLNTVIDQHINASSNPHKIDKEKVGLGNVPNVSTNEQSPTYAEATEDETLVSGETLAVAFGKLARAVRSLWAHIGNKKNPHGVDFFQAYQQIFSEAYAAPDAEGSFVGDGNSTITINGFQRPGKIINLGFTPSRVLILILGTTLAPGHSESDTLSMEMAATLHNVRAIYFGTGKNYYHSGCFSGMNTAAPETLLNQGHGGAAVCENGFVIQYNGGMYVNEKGVQHIYCAWK